MSKSALKPATIHLKDYKAPEFLINSIDLTFELGEEETIVTSRLALQRSDPAAETLRLNGEHLELLSIAKDEAPLDKAGYELTDKHLTLPVATGEESFKLEIKTRLKPQENTALEGLQIKRKFLHAMRGTGVSPHHLLS